MKNEILEQLKEKISKKLEKESIEVVAIEELYEKVWTNITDYVENLEHAKETINVLIEPYNDNDQMFVVRYEIIKELTNTKHSDIYISAGDNNVNFIDGIYSKLKQEYDLDYFNEYKVENGKIFLSTNYVQIASALKIHEICKKLIPKMIPSENKLSE